MHYDTHYEDLEGQDKIDKGLSDIKDWLGYGRFNDLTKQFEAHEKLPFDQFQFLASVAGIQGYPVTAWYATLWPEAIN